MVDYRRGEYPPCKGCGNHEGPGIHYDDCSFWKEWQKTDPTVALTIKFVKRP